MLQCTKQADTVSSDFARQPDTVSCQTQVTPSVKAKMQYKTISSFYHKKRKRMHNNVKNALNGFLGHKSLAHMSPDFRSPDLKSLAP